MPKFACFFRRFDRVHEHKDVGKIPYILDRDYEWESRIICREKKDLDNISQKDFLRIDFISEIPLISKFLGFLSKRTSQLPFEVSKKFEVLRTTTDSFMFFRNNRDIDILNLYHFRYDSLIVAYIFKKLSDEGKVYLKMDHGSFDENKDQSNWKKRILLNLADIDLISNETKNGYRYIEKEHPILSNYECKKIYLPNGIDKKECEKYKTDKEKRQALHVGRLGKSKKRSNLVLEMFREIHKENDMWNLVLTGSMTEDFKKRVEKAEEELGEDKIEYRGFVEKKELYELYNNSMIFLAPSKSEGFPLAPIEGLYFGNNIIGTSLDPIKELTNDGKLGRLCDVEDRECLLREAKKSVQDEEETRRMGQESGKFIEMNFVWEKICKNLNEELNKLR